MVVTSISPTEHSVRPKLRAWRSYSGVSEAMEETRVATLTEPLRMSGVFRRSPSQIRHEGRNMLRGEVFYDDAYYHLRILGSRD